MADQSPNLAAPFAGLNVNDGQQTIECVICRETSPVADMCHPAHATGAPLIGEMKRIQEDCARLHWFHANCINRWRASGRSAGSRCPVCRTAFSSIVDANNQAVILEAMGAGGMALMGDDDEDDQRQQQANDDIVRAADRERRGVRRRREEPQDTPLPAVPTDLKTAQEMPLDHFTRNMCRQFRARIPAVENVTAEGESQYQSLLAHFERFQLGVQGFDTNQVGECRDPNYTLPRTQLTPGGLTTRANALGSADADLTLAKTRLVSAIDAVMRAVRIKAQERRNERQYRQEIIRLTLEDRLDAQIRRRRREEQEEDNQDRHQRRRLGRR